MLLDHPGEVVLREEIRKALWPNDTVVEFDSGINAAIQRLRNSLSDSADNPRYVETLARRGYRFIGTVDLPEASPPEREPLAAQPDATPEPDPDPGDLSGHTLAHFRVIRKLGTGGMGVVYLGDDLKLGRQVALKFLRQSEEASAQMRERFQREARAASALSHPNICTVYGVEELARQPAIVMELVEGETLEARLAKGALPVAKALPLAIQLASALDAAHRRGIVHRDLKPANIMLTRSGVKVLDFGIAKMERTGPLGEETATQVTQAGAVPGTRQYMSPEQAQGRDADARSDLFSFGAVLLEMLTGQRAFSGETAADLIGAILTKDPLEDAGVAALVPPAMMGILRHCLEKNPEDRFQSARDLVFALESLGSPSPLPDAPRAQHGAKVPRLAWGAAAAAILGTIGVAFLHFGEKPPVPPAPVRFQIAPPENVVIGNCCQKISPDGHILAFTAGGRLWVHFMDSGENRELTSASGQVSWTPDSRFIVYQEKRKLKRIQPASGPPETLGDLLGLGTGGGTWIQDNMFLGSSRDGFYKIPASGGAAVPVTRVDSERQDEFGASLLPDRKHFLYGSLSAGGVYLGDMSTKPEQQSSKPLLRSNWQAEYVASAGLGDGFLLFMRDGTLMAQPFDSTRLELNRQPQAVAAEVDDNRGGTGGLGDFSASPDVLVFRGKPARDRQFTLYNRDGRVLGTAGEPGEFGNTVRISPDGKRLAFSRLSGAVIDIWLLDLTPGGAATRFTFSSSEAVNPVWSPDGSRIVFSLSPAGKPSNLYEKPVDGSKAEELLVKTDEEKQPSSWSPDGRYLLYSSYSPSSATGWDLWVLPLEGGRKPVPFLMTQFSEINGHFSPDGRWVAYLSNESGRFEVYVRPFSMNAAGTSAEQGGKWQVSTGGGTGPRWRSDGRELYYRSPDGGVQAVEIATAPSFRAGIPHSLAPASDLQGNSLWDVTRRGDFLLAPLVKSGPQSYNVVLNWQSGLKR
jgi:serine/threonine protein kinase/Tol biopolymer transport system component